MKVDLICMKCHHHYDTIVYGNVNVIPSYREKMSLKRKVDNGTILFTTEVVCPRCSSHSYKIGQKLQERINLAMLSPLLPNIGEPDDQIVFVEPMLNLTRKKMSTYEGQKFFEKKVRESPNDAMLNFKYACVLQWLNLYNDAIKYLKLALKHRPTYALPCFNLGRIYHWREEYEKSLYFFAIILMLPRRQEKMKEILPVTEEYLVELKEKISKKKWKTIMSTIM